MDRIFLKESKVRVFSIGTALVSIIFIGVFLQSCNDEDKIPDTIDEEVINSPELEEYIIAGADFQQSLAAFTAGLNKIDFTTLEVTYEPGWIKVVHLPVSSVGIEEKIKNLNEKKKVLLKKFPQFASLENSKEYFRQSIENSVNVRGELLKLGFNSSKPLLKSGSEGSFSNWPNTFYLSNFLDSWVNSPDYVEAIILLFDDGYWGVYIDSQNTPFESNINLTPTRNSNGDIIGYKYNSRTIVSFGHTHGAGISGPNPSSGDGALVGVDNFIYYDGAYYYY